MKNIKFKSTPENWKKELIGLKPNTVRKKDDDVRFDILEKFIQEPFELIIYIENTVTKSIFNRQVQDVTKFDDYYIISWK